MSEAVILNLDAAIQHLQVATKVMEDLVAENARLTAEVERWKFEANHQHELKRHAQHAMAKTAPAPDPDDAPELTGNELDRPDALFKMGDKIITREEFVRAWREAKPKDSPT